MPLTTDERLLALSRDVLKGFEKVDGVFIQVSDLLMPKVFCWQEHSRPRQKLPRLRPRHILISIPRA